MPPASRNHRVPTAGDTPALTAASSLECPVAIAAQNRRCFSCRRTEGRPGERSFARPARSERLLRVVIATPFGAVLRRPVELKLHAPIAVMHQRLRLDDGAIVERLLQRIESQVAAQRGRRPPANDPTREHVDDERTVHEPAPRGDVRQIGDPQLVRPHGLELPRHQIRRSRRRGIRDRRHCELPPAHRACEAQAPHQARHRTAGDGLPFALELLPDFADAVDLAVLLPHATDVLAQSLVPPRPPWPAVGIAIPCFELVVQRRGDRQDRADRLDPELLPVLVDEPDHHLARRSSSAFAKYAEASRRISFARRNSTFSRSSCLNRARSSVVSPGRWPPSRSACRTQLRSVSAAHPIFSAIEVIAAHCDACSWVCSNTIRTARSRTSGENRLGLAMTPSSQGMEPPINPGRFMNLRELEPRWNQNQLTLPNRQRHLWCRSASTSRQSPSWHNAKPWHRRPDLREVGV